MLVLETKMSIEDRYRESIIKNPKSYPFYLMLACELDDLHYLQRAQLITADILSNVPLNVLQLCARSGIAPKVHKEIYKSQIYFGPKASLFFAKPGAITSPTGVTNLLSAFVKPNAFDKASSHMSRAMSELSRSKRDTANSSVVIIARDPKIVKKSVLGAISKPIICCWHVASGKRMGEIETIGNLKIYHGTENTVERLSAALDYIETDYIFIIGDDDFVFDEFLENGERFLDYYPGLGAVCGIGTDASHLYTSPSAPKDGSTLKLIRMSENPISVVDLEMRALEWALFGGLSWNCLLRKRDLVNILHFRPPPEMAMASEYFIDICLILLGTSLRIDKFSIIRGRGADSGTYTVNPPVLETVTSGANVLREITNSVLGFCHANHLEIGDNIVEWIVAYGSSRRFLENTAFNEGISTLPKALSTGQRARLFPEASKEYKRYLIAVAAALFEDKICVK